MKKKFFFTHLKEMRRENSEFGKKKKKRNLEFLRQEFFQTLRLDIMAPKKKIREEKNRKKARRIFIKTGNGNRSFHFASTEYEMCHRFGKSCFLELLARLSNCLYQNKLKKNLEIS